MDSETLPVGNIAEQITTTIDKSVSPIYEKSWQTKHAESATIKNRDWSVYRATIKRFRHVRRESSHWAIKILWQVNARMRRPAFLLPVYGQTIKKSGHCTGSRSLWGLMAATIMTVSVKLVFGTKGAANHGIIHQDSLGGLPSTSLSDAPRHRCIIEPGNPTGGRASC